MSVDKKILVLGGGVLQGVFGAGVVTTLQKNNAYDHIEAVYGISAGAFNGAYFLARQSELGASIYYDDLSKKFFHPKRLAKTILQKITRKKDVSNDLIDIDHLMTIMSTSKKLDIAKLKQQPIPMYVALLNTVTGQTEFIDVRKGDTKSILHGAVNIAPYYKKEIKINNISYIDGGIQDPLCVAHILKRHPDKKIIYVLNQRPSSFSFFRQVRGFFEGLVAHTDNRLLFSVFWHREFSRIHDYKKALQSKNIELIMPSKRETITVYKSDKDNLKAYFELGKEYGQQITNLLES